MISTPDFYNDFGKLVNQDFQYKLNNDLLPDLSKVDPLKLQKQAKEQYMATLIRLFHNCPVNGKFEKSTKELRVYTEKYISENYPLLQTETMMNILQNTKQNEMLNLLEPMIQDPVINSV